MVKAKNRKSPSEMQRGFFTYRGTIRSSFKYSYQTRSSQKPIVGRDHVSICKYSDRKSMVLISAPNAVGKPSVLNCGVRWAWPG